MKSSLHSLIHFLPFLLNRLRLQSLSVLLATNSLLNLSLSLTLGPTAPIWGLRPDFYYWQTAAGLLMRGALSDERTGLSFTIVADPR
jgi:hypothetical protein